jgi:hypothetical protein
MSSVVINGDTSGAVTLSAPAVAGTVTVTLPATSGTMLTTASSTGISGSAISSGTVAEAYGGTGTNTGYYGFKNRIINGAMVIDQRNAGASVTPTNGQFLTDRFGAGLTQASKFTAQQSTTAPTGFINSQSITSSSAYSITSTDKFWIYQPIEGLNIADLAWGTASASTVTLSFWVRSSLTGTFGGSLQNSAQNRSYPFSYTINAANTFEQKSITITGDTSGTWLTTNGTGIYLNIGLGVGSTLSGTANSWAGANYFSATGATSVVGTNGATFYITGVQLEKGSTTTSFDYRPYGTEFSLCQRYFEKSVADGVNPSSITNPSPTLVGSSYNSSTVRTQTHYKVSKRATPTLTRVPSATGGTGSQWSWYNAGWNNGATSVAQNNQNAFSVDTSASGLTANGSSIIDGNWYADAEL